MALHKPEHRTVFYWTSWIPLTILFMIVFPLALIFRGYASTRRGWLRDLENYIDDPIDWCKEWLHCRSLPFNLQLNISFLMQNRTTTWNIIRPDRMYDNCDPEDWKDYDEPFGM